MERLIMERVIKVFLADASKDFLDLLQIGLEQQPDIAVTGAVTRGDEAYALVSTSPPDVLICDLLLPGLDGLSLLRRLKQEERLPKTVIVSAFVNNSMATAVSLLGVEDYFLKPCAMNDLVHRVREAAGARRQHSPHGCDTAIRRALALFGIPPNLNGRQYLEEALRRVLADRSVLRGITKILYPDLARVFDTTPICIERSIRSAVDKAWEQGDPEARHVRFNGMFDAFRGSPSNAKFISTIAEYIELDAGQAAGWTES